MDPFAPEIDDDYYDPEGEDIAQFSDPGSVTGDDLTTATEDDPAPDVPVPSDAPTEFPAPDPRAPPPPAEPAGPPTADSLILPPSPPTDPLQETWYPPLRASPNFWDNLVQFYFEGRWYGWFLSVVPKHAGFRLQNLEVLELYAPFLGECTKEPQSRDDSSKAHADLLTAKRSLNRSLKEHLGMVLENNPPFIVHSRRHPLHESLKEALNHHRIKRTDMNALQKLVKNVIVPDSKSLFQSCKTKPVIPKVAGLFGSKAEKGVDEVLDFINIPTQ